MFATMILIFTPHTRYGKSLVHSSMRIVQMFVIHNLLLRKKHLHISIRFSKAYFRMFFFLLSSCWYLGTHRHARPSYRWATSCMQSNFGGSNLLTQPVMKHKKMVLLIKKWLFLWMALVEAEWHTCTISWWSSLLFVTKKVLPSWNCSNPSPRWSKTHETFCIPIPCLKNSIICYIFLTIC